MTSAQTSSGNTQDYTPFLYFKMKPFQPHQASGEGANWTTGQFFRNLVRRGGGRHILWITLPNAVGFTVSTNPSGVPAGKKAKGFI